LTRHVDENYRSQLQDPDFEPVDSWAVSALAADIELTEEFKQKYEVWLQHEVFNNSIDWDQLLNKKLIAG
jgi:hypothetical protein